MIAGVIVIPLIEKFGGGNPAKGYQLTAAVVSVVALVTGLTTFLNVKGNNDYTQIKKKESLKESVNVVIKNHPPVKGISVTVAHIMENRQNSSKPSA